MTFQDKDTILPPASVIPLSRRDKIGKRIIRGIKFTLPSYFILQEKDTMLPNTIIIYLSFREKIGKIISRIIKLFLRNFVYHIIRI